MGGERTVGMVGQSGGCIGQCLDVVAGMFVTLASAWSGIKSGR
jgi:hypothetical protein